ncbi:MAG: hypothetical protein K1V87_08120 [Muribaculum sp.]
MKAFLQLLWPLVIGLLLAWLLSINPVKEYGWFMGLIHGGLLVPNWIISWFDSSWLLSAPLHTTMYTVDWWIAAVLNVIGWVWIVIGFFGNLFRK